MEKLKKRDMDNDLFKKMDVTSGSGSNIMKKGSMSSFLQRGSSTSTGHDSLRQTTLNEIVKDSNAVNEEVCRMIYAEGLPFNLVRSSYFKKAVEAIANFGKGYTPPSYHEA